MDYNIFKHYPLSYSTYVIQSKMIGDKLHAYVFDKDGYKYVKVKPNVLIARALKKINSSFSHARDISKSILGEQLKKLPLIVSNHYGQPLIMFPLFSPGSDDNIWVTYNTITHISGQKNLVIVEFNHQSVIELNVSRQSFNNQYVHAANLFKGSSSQWRS